MKNLRDELNKSEYNLTSHEVERIVKLFNTTLSGYKARLREKIKKFDRKSHICPFNDGDQDCDCFNEGFDKTLSILEEL